MKTRSEALWDLAPAMRRARGFHLYDGNRRRYLDLYLDGGTAVLGHRTAGLLREVKAVGSRCGLAAMPSIYPARLARALSRAYPGFRGVVLAGNEAEALALAARYLECEPAGAEICDPALGQTGRVLRDRPFLPAAVREQALEQAEVVIPALPLAGALCPILFRREAPEAQPRWLPPVDVAAALRAFYDLRRCAPPLWLSRDLLADSSPWVQRGLYVAPRFDEERYAGVYRRFLSQGVLLPPVFPGPAVLPMEATEGEIALLSRLFREDVPCS